jgi:hypothetical protein
MSSGGWIIRDVLDMEESVTYQAIIEKGEANGRREGVRRVLLVLGENHFGPASSEVTATIQGINDLEQLLQLVVRVGQVGGWDELLRSPSS